MVLDLAASVAKPTISKGKGSLSRPDVDSAKPSPTRPPDSGPMTFLRSEGLPWDKFKQVVTDKDIAICYDMSMKEFERSTVHDLFKVFLLVLSHTKIEHYSFYLTSMFPNVGHVQVYGRV